jgi:tRNA(Ile)-lysidine synthase
VVTGHTATDRAETVLLNLARGCHRRGLASLRASRPLRSAAGSGGDGPDDPDGIRLVRPLLILSREETGRFCCRQGVPVWQDATNADGRLRRNRVRAELLPVLEQLHPGACRRISLQADRLAEEEDHTDELTALALRGLATGGETRQAPPDRLDRRALVRLSAAGQRRLLQRWIVDRTGLDPGTGALEELIAALPPQRGGGQRALRGGWRLRWDRRTLVLDPPEPPHGRTP